MKDDWIREEVWDINNIFYMLTEQEVIEYQEIHKKIYWTEISKEEALTSGTSLITLMEAVLKGNMNDNI